MLSQLENYAYDDIVVILRALLSFQNKEKHGSDPHGPNYPEPIFEIRMHPFKPLILFACILE
jgi:hypothetical protein